MAHWEYSKTYDFSAKAYIPFQYTCGKCGKLVTGRAEIKEGLTTKDTSRNPSDLKFNRIDTNSMQAQAVSKLRQQLMMRRGEVKCEDFSLLEPHRKCPHCGAIQKWGTHIVTTILFTLLGLGGFILIVPCVRLFLPKKDWTWLASAVIPLLCGVMFGLKAVMNWKDILSAGSGSKQKPEVFFDRLESPWRDELLK